MGEVRCTVAASRVREPDYGGSKQADATTDIQNNILFYIISVDATL